MNIATKEDYTVIPINVFMGNKLSYVVEDGMLSDCFHEDTISDSVTFNGGMDNEYSHSAECCNVCGAWYDVSSEEWV